MNQQLSPAPEAERAFTEFQLSTIEAMKVLAAAGLYTQLMMIVYSAIDAAGLLDAPLAQVDADGPSFKAWVTKYMAPEFTTDPNPEDLWGARCALLHAFGSESNLSRRAKAREVAAYWGAGDPQKVAARCQQVKTATGSDVVPMELSNFIAVFGRGFGQFALDFAEKCRTDPQWESRARKLVAHYLVST